MTSYFGRTRFLRKGFRPSPPRKRSHPTNLVVALLIVLVFGAWPCAAQTPVSFSGRLDFNKNDFEVRLDYSDQGTIDADISLHENTCQLTASFNRFTIGAQEITSDLTGSFEPLPGGKNGDFRGIFKTQNTLFNGKPIDELSGRFEITQGQLRMQNISWGGLTMAGTFGLFDPYDVNSSFLLSEVMLEEVLMMLGYKDKGTPLYGIVTGMIKISGPAGQRLVKGNLKARKGIIEDIPYEVFNLNFEGIYPVVRINDSNIFKTDGVGFNLSGQFDLSKGQGGVGQGILGLEKSPLVTSDGSQSEWTIKRKEAQGTARVSELKYRIDNSSQGQQHNKDSNMIGVQQSIKF